jgi:hypothetical protein
MDNYIIEVAFGDPQQKKTVEVEAKDADEAIKKAQAEIQAEVVSFRFIRCP